MAAARFDFPVRLAAAGLAARPVGVETLQANLTRLCNQACRHCHVDASPERREQMDRRTVDRCLAILAEHDGIRTLDLTGGAPELNPHFESFAVAARALGKRVMVRHNLTVTLDPHPVTGASLEHLPRFFAEHGIEVVSSLPYYQEYFTDRQRGSGVFDKSIASLLLLNEEGYGREGSGLELDLVYNPVGAFLPAAQATLEADYRRELRQQFGIEFTRLFAIVNMPINRFRGDLERHGGYERYMERLTGAFNPTAVEGLMCRTMVSVDHEGRLYDCDFNQMEGLVVATDPPMTVFDFDLERYLARPIRFESHCFGCTAGVGSSCGGATT